MKPYIFDTECHLNAAWLPLETKPTSFPCSVSGRPGHCLFLAQLSIFSLFLKGETKPAAKPGWFCWFLSFRSPEQRWRRMAGNPAGRRGETPRGAGGTVCHQGPPHGAAPAPGAELPAAPVRTRGSAWAASFYSFPTVHLGLVPKYNF